MARDVRSLSDAELRSEGVKQRQAADRTDPPAPVLALTDATDPVEAWRRFDTRRDIRS